MESVNKSQLVAAVGITIDKHKSFAGTRLEPGDSASKVCDCHLQSLIDQGALVVKGVKRGLSNG